MKLTTGNAGVLTGESFVLCLGSTPHELKSRLNEDYYRPCRSADRGVIFFFQVPALMNTGSCSLDAMAIAQSFCSSHLQLMMQSVQRAIVITRHPSVCLSLLPFHILIISSETISIFFVTCPLFNFQSLVLFFSLFSISTHMIPGWSPLLSVPSVIRFDLV